MRLVVKQGDNVVGELKFSKGPIYIGRQIGNQIFLPNRAVSRQHAVIYTIQNGKWIVEDLDSANKTYLSDHAVHKAELSDGDVLQIADFSIQVHFDSRSSDTQPIDLADTLRTVAHEPETIVRKITSDDAPVIRMPPKRVADFRRAVATISKASDGEKLRLALLEILMRQFAAFRVWVGLRSGTTGAMIYYAGMKRTHETVKLDTLELKDKILQAVEKKAYILVPRMPTSKVHDRIRSAIISPVIGEDGCYGVLYVDNSAEHEHYSLADLDYLIFIAMHTAAVLKNF